MESECRNEQPLLPEFMPVTDRFQPFSLSLSLFRLERLHESSVQFLAVEHLRDVSLQLNSRPPPP